VRDGVRALVAEALAALRAEELLEARVAAGTATVTDRRHLRGLALAHDPSALLPIERTLVPVDEDAARAFVASLIDAVENPNLIRIDGVPLEGFGPVTIEERRR
jgi:hypothetical protein